MCGFFFETSKKLRKKNIIEIKELKSDLQRRGPDKFKFIEKPNFSIFFSRLSIIDRNERSDQPFTDKEKRYYLIFNGEIYNYIEIKNLLKNEGVKFNTTSDTEVLFKLIIFKGIEKSLKIIQGMFSFIFYDSKEQKIFCARDHFGQKPFYYHKSKNKFLASTNIRPILRKLEKKKINKESIIQYLSSEVNGLIEINKTLFKEISVLPAGSYLYYYKDKIKIKKYFNAIDLFNKKKYLILNKMNEKQIISLLDKKIEKAVKKHLISDTKIGVTCSGGIDSSLVTKYAYKQNKKIYVLTNTSKGIEKLSRQVPKILENNKINKKNVCFIKQNKNEYLKYLIKLIQYNCTPARWASGPPMGILCNIAKKRKIKVILGGDGVDEYFCGYNSFFKSLYKKNIYGLHDILILNTKYNSNKKIISKFYKNIIFSKKKISKKINFIKNNLEKKIITNSLLDTEYFLQSCPLPHSDEYSMYESIEMRNPFLDLELVELCLNLPGKFKISKNNKFKNKFILRQLAIQKYGKYLNKDKEGTRNYGKFISNKNFWNFDNFIILKLIKFKNKLSFREIFKLINLEIFLRENAKNNSDYLKEILTKDGLKKLGISNNII